MVNLLSGKPEKFFIAAASAKGLTELNAFDMALIKAGIGNYNLVKVSSIIPPGAKHAESVDLPEGAILPIAYGACISAEKGKLISAAVAVGLPKEKDGVGIIAEFAGEVNEEEARMNAKLMAEEALRVRNLTIKEILVGSSSIVVDGPSCAFAGVAVW